MKKVLFIGDSITDVIFNKRTWALKAKKAYPLQVMAEINKSKEFKPYFKGIASNRSWHVYDRFTKDCVDIMPDIIVMLIGVNDAWTAYKPEDYIKKSRVYMPNRPFEQHFDELIRRMKMEMAQTKVILMLPFVISTISEKLPFKEFLKPYNAHILAKAEEVGYKCIDLQSIFDEAEKTHKPIELSTDGVHPTTLGHSFIAKAVIDSLK